MALYAKLILFWISSRQIKAKKILSASVPFFDDVIDCAYS
jgi:hypothetical protein